MLVEIFVAAKGISLGLQIPFQDKDLHIGKEMSRLTATIEFSEFGDASFKMAACEIDSGKGNARD